MSLTDTDEYALQKLPVDQWFDIMDIPPEVSRPRYRCDRLEEAGLLESRIIGEIPALTKQWRRIDENLCPVCEYPLNEENGIMVCNTPQCENNNSY